MDMENSITSSFAAALQAFESPMLFQDMVSKQLVILIASIPPKQDPHLDLWLLRQKKFSILSVLGQIIHILSLKVLCIPLLLKSPYFFLPWCETTDQQAFFLPPCKPVSVFFSMSWGAHPPAAQTGSCLNCKARRKTS